MKNTTVAGLVIVLFVAVVAVRQVGRAGQAPVPTGGTAAEQAIAKARAARQPVVLSFRSKTCKPCVAMAAVVAELRPKYAGRVAVIDISLDDDTPDMKLVEQYQIAVKPTTVVLTAAGEMAETRVGVWRAEELSRRLDDMLGRR